MPTPEQFEAAKLYADLIGEIGVRIDAINPESMQQYRLPGPLMREFCYLQMRMICELVALGCLVAHGDIERTSSLRKAWNADEIMDKLEQLHPDFFPVATVIDNIGGTNHTVTLVRDAMTKQEVIDLYHESNRHLHKGSLRNLLNGKSPSQLDYAAVTKHVEKLIALLRCHTVTMLGGGTMFMCILRATETLSPQVEICEANISRPGERTYTMKIA
jgi:hypothetical protein